MTENALHKYRDRAEPLLENAEEVYMISETVASALADTVNPQGVFCVFKMKPQGKAETVPNGKYLALDGVQDPANLGAAARTAEALGLSGLITAGGCDVFNPKAQRAAMGALLRLRDGLRGFTRIYRGLPQKGYADLCRRSVCRRRKNH